MGCQGLHPEGLRGIVTAIEDIQPEFFRQSERPVWAFPGDESVYSSRSGLLEPRTRPPRDDPDATASTAAARQEFGNYSQCLP